MALSSSSSPGGLARADAAQRSSAGWRHATALSTSVRKTRRRRSVARRARAFHQGDRAHPHRRRGQADLRQDRGRRRQRILRRRAQSGNWLVVNTERIAATRGCGSGDAIKAMLAAEKLGGKCADIKRPFRRPRSGGGASCTRPLRPSRRLFALRLQEPRRRFDRRHQGPALPSRRLARGDWLDADGRSRRPKGHAGGAADSYERGRA